LEPKQHDANQQQRYKTVEGMDRKFATCAGATVAMTRV
jgi:hypothetical protein